MGTHVHKEIYSRKEVPRPNADVQRGKLELAAREASRVSEQQNAMSNQKEIEIAAEEGSSPTSDPWRSMSSKIARYVDSLKPLLILISSSSSNRELNRSGP